MFANKQTPRQQGSQWASYWVGGHMREMGEGRSDVGVELQVAEWDTDEYSS